MPYFGSEETVKDLKRALSNPNVQADRLRYRNYITRVIRSGLDVSSLFMEMVKASATVDIVQKKLVYLYMVTYAGHKPDLALLAINTLRKDCADPNPMVRGLALRNMCNLRYLDIYKSRGVVLQKVLDGVFLLCGFYDHVLCFRMPGITEYIQHCTLSWLCCCVAVVQTFRDLVWFCPQSTGPVCKAVEGCDETPQDDEGKQALLWLLGAHGELISSAPYLLEGFIDGLKVEISSAVKMELLTSTLKLFLSRPAETQDMLGRLLHYCIEDEADMNVRDRAGLYYRLLQSGPDRTRQILLGPNSDPSMTVLTGRPEEPVSVWASSFNTLGSLCGTGAGPENLPAEDSAHQVHAAEEEPLSDAAAAELDLTAGPPISHEAFERLWLDLQVVHQQVLEVRRPREPPETLQAAFLLVKIQTLAFSRSDAALWKAYVYSRAGGTLLLAELLQGAPEEPESEGMLLVSIKQQPENQSAVRNFISVLKRVLQTLSSNTS
uniref:Adaptor related protein complex 4 subunit beta 1 n=1 Tax=Astyanax mexicanus TaxID=7994 RepID=A0A8B9H8E4_ASTMX